jgi:hypothetical protein
VLVLAMLYATFLHLRDTAHGREDIRGAGQWLDANVPEDEEILITSTEIPEAVSDMPFDDRSRSIFIVGRAWLSDPDGKLQTALADRYPTCSNVNLPGIRIHCYQADGAAALATAKR